MARIIYTLGELRGSVGGLTFQENASGKIVRQRPLISRSSTIKQQAIHATQQNLLHEWSLLSSIQRDKWNDYAAVYTKIDKFGQVKTLTGANWFTSVNYMRGLMGLSLLPNPPVHTPPASITDFNLIISALDIKLKVYTIFDSNIHSIIIWTSLPTRRQKSTINQIRKYVTIKNTLTTTAFSIKSEWEAATGLDWKPLTLFPNMNIFVCLEVVGKANGITAPMTCKKANTNDILEDEETIIYYT